MHNSFTEAEAARVDEAQPAAAAAEAEMESNRSKLCVVVCVQRTSRRSPDLRFPLFQDLIQSSGSRGASWASPCSAVLQLSQICPFDATAGA